MSLGLPSFSMIFTGKAVSAIERSARVLLRLFSRMAPKEEKT
ncbi:MAG: hypothetical protein ACLVCH_04135 [Roseburia inulinivorans]